MVVAEQEGILFVSAIIDRILKHEEEEKRITWTEFVKCSYCECSNSLSPQIKNTNYIEKDATNICVYSTWVYQLIDAL